MPDYTPPIVGARVIELGRLDPRPEWYGPVPGPILDEAGKAVMRPDGQKPIINFPGLPRHLPAGRLAAPREPEPGLAPWEIELYLRNHSKMGYADIWARQPAGTPEPTAGEKNNANNNRLRHARKPYNALSWVTKCAGTPKEWVMVMETLTPQQIVYNTTWPIVNGMIQQPGTEFRIPLGTFLINGQLHQPSQRVKDAIDLSIRMGAVAAVHGVDHWSKLGKSHKDFPEVWNNTEYADSERTEYSSSDEKADVNIGPHDGYVNHTFVANEEVKHEQDEDEESTMKLEAEILGLEHNYLNIPSGRFSKQVKEEPTFSGAFSSVHHETYGVENSAGSRNPYLGSRPPPNPTPSTPSNVPGTGSDYGVAQGYHGSIESSNLVQYRGFVEYASVANQHLSSGGFLQPNTVDNTYSGVNPPSRAYGASDQVVAARTGYDPSLPVIDSPAELEQLLGGSSAFYDSSTYPASRSRLQRADKGSRGRRHRSPSDAKPDISENSFGEHINYEHAPTSAGGMSYWERQLMDVGNRELNVRGKAGANEDMDSGYESPRSMGSKRTVTRRHANRHGVKRRNPSLESGIPPPAFLESRSSALVQDEMEIKPLKEETDAAKKKVKVEKHLHDQFFPIYADDVPEPVVETAVKTSKRHDTDIDSPEAKPKSKRTKLQ